MKPAEGKGLGALFRAWGKRLLSPYYLVALGVIVFLGASVNVGLAGGPTAYFAESLALASIFITLALAWDFSSGLTGYLSLGLPLFFALGAYTTGYLVWHGEQSIPTLLLVSLVVGTMGGFLFTLSTLRLRGAYFALFSLLLPLIGADFVTGFWVQLKMPEFAAYYNLPFLGSSWGAELILLSAVNAVLLTVFFLLKDTHFGLILRGIRDDEDAVSSQGIRTFPYKVVAFTIAGAVAGFIGSAYALYATDADVDTLGFEFLILPILIVILGGLGEIAGAVLAGFAVILVYQYLFQAISTGALLIFTGVTIVLGMFLPGGMLRSLRRFIEFMRTPEDAL